MLGDADRHCPKEPGGKEKAAAVGRDRSATSRLRTSAMSQKVFRAWGVSALGRFGAVVVLIAVAGVFSILRPETFPTLQNLQTMAQVETVAVVLSGAVLIPFVVGEFDLSVGNVLGFSGVMLVHMDSVSIIGDIGLVLAGGAIIGLINGLVVTRLRVHSFIATLGMSSIVGGLSLALSGGQVLYKGLPNSFLALGRASVYGINPCVAIAAILLGVMWYVLNHMPIGRQMYGIGGNATVARLSGVPVGAISCACFVVSGAIAAAAGIIEIAQIGSADPTFGPNFLLPAFAGVFLGATTITPGRPNVLGVVVAVTLLTVITTGLGQLGAPQWVEPVFDGVVLISAVAVSLVVAGRGPRVRAAGGEAS